MSQLKAKVLNVAWLTASRITVLRVFNVGGTLTGTFETHFDERPAYAQARNYWIAGPRDAHDCGGAEWGLKEQHPSSVQGRISHGCSSFDQGGQPACDTESPKRSVALTI